MIFPRAVLSLSESTGPPPAILDVLQPIEFAVATGSSSFRKSIETDTAVTLGTSSHLTLAWRSLFTEMTRRVSGGHFDNFLDSKNASFQKWKMHYSEIDRMVGRFLNCGGASTASVVAHTASWTASAVWRAKLDASVRTENKTSEYLGSRACKDVHFLDTKPSGSLGGKSLAFYPPRLRWFKPPCLPLALVKQSTIRCTWFPNSSRPCFGFAQIYSVGTKESADAGVSGEALLHVACPLYQDIRGNFVIGGVHGKQHADQVKLFETHAVRDAILIKVGRFIDVNTEGGGASPRIEFLIFSFHPYTFELVSLGINSNPLHEFPDASFEHDTVFGIWLQKHQR